MNGSLADVYLVLTDLKLTEAGSALKYNPDQSSPSPFYSGHRSVIAILRATSNHRVLVFGLRINKGNLTLQEHPFHLRKPNEATTDTRVAKPVPEGVLGGNPTERYDLSQPHIYPYLVSSRFLCPPSLLTTVTLRRTPRVMQALQRE